MSFELTIRDNEEYIDEIITHTHQTKKVWSKKLLQNTIIDLTEQIVEIESRITVLTEQLARFKK